MEYYEFPIPDAAGYNFNAPAQLERTTEDVPFGFTRRGQRNEKYIIELSWTLSLEAYMSFAQAYILHRDGTPFIIKLTLGGEPLAYYRGVFVGGTFKMSHSAPNIFTVSAIIEAVRYES